MLFTILIESFKFEDEDDKEDEINFKFFSRTLLGPVYMEWGTPV